MEDYERIKTKYCYNPAIFRSNNIEEQEEMKNILINSLKELVSNNELAKSDFLSVAKVINNDFSNEKIHILGSIGIGFAFYLALSQINGGQGICPQNEFINEYLKLLASFCGSTASYACSEIIKNIMYLTKSNKIASLVNAMQQNADFSTIQPEEVFSDTDPKIMRNELECLSCNALSELALDNAFMEYLNNSITNEQEK